MTSDERAIATAIAEDLGRTTRRIVTDIGSARPSIPPYRAHAHVVCVTIGDVVYDVQVLVTRTQG